MKVKDLIKCLEILDEQEDVKNTFLFTEEKTFRIMIKEINTKNNKDDFKRLQR